MSALDQLLGTWETTMHHSSMTTPVPGHQHYARMLDGAFVQLRATYEHPDFPDALAVITDTQYHYFDVRGVIRLFDLHIDEGGWTMVHLDDDFSQRHTARFRGPDVMESTGERSADRGATWQHDFTMTYRRI